MTGSDTPADATEPLADFEVVLARSGKTIEVPAGSTILWALLQAGVEPAYSCGAGICGACEVDVLEGTPVHRDFVLSDADKAEGNRMIICCGRSATPRLVIDL